MIITPETLKKLDYALDFIPVASTFSNFFNLAYKATSKPSDSHPIHHFFKHIKDKSTLKCVILLVPVLGNIVVGIHELCNKLNIYKAIEILYLEAMISHYNDQPSKVIQYLTRADAMGSLDHTNILALIYLDEKNAEHDYDKGIALLEKAAGQDHVHAIYNLGLEYKKGNVVGQDFTKAVSYFNQAIAKGSIEAHMSLGLCYLNGEGVEKNPLEGIRLLNKAVEMDTLLGYVQDTGKNALAHLMNYYLSEECKDDHTDAIIHARAKYDEVDLDSAACSIGLLFLNGTILKGTETIKIKNEKKAIAYFKKSIELGASRFSPEFAPGSRKAICHLAQCYFLGQGTEVDYPKALELFQQINDHDTDDLKEFAAKNIPILERKIAKKAEEATV